jgi:molecular chaperone GrpE (heat shock protein)
MALKQATEEFMERVTNVLDDLHVAIEARNTTDQHTALAALIGLIEMLKAEVDDAEDAS